MNSGTKKFIALAIALGIALCVSACGGGGDAMGGAMNAPGTLTVAIKDADIDGWDEALLEVSAITLIGDGGQDREVLDAPQTIDLLKLRNVSEILLRETLTARTITKIRLGVEGITLNKVDESTGAITQTTSPPVPTRKIDLLLKPGLEIRAGADVIVWLDFDLHNSIKLTNTGNGVVRFRPLVRVRAAASGLVRLYGTYTDDAASDNNELCNLERVSDADGDYDVLDLCVTLAESDDTSYFGEDSQPFDGPIPFGDHVSVYGYYRSAADGPVLDAEIIVHDNGDRGSIFTTLNGIAATDLASTADEVPPTNQAEFDLRLTDSTIVPVRLSLGGKLFNRDGERIDPPALTAGERAEARGTLTEAPPAEPAPAAQPGDPAPVQLPVWLQAFIVFVSGPDSNDTTSGTIAGITASTLTLDPPSEPICVTTSPDTDYFEVMVDGDTTTGGVIARSRLMLDDQIEASGDRVGDCIVARTVIREVPPPPG